MIRVVLLSLLLSGCATTNAPQAVLNSFVFGGSVSFVHKPDKLILEEVNRRIRKEIHKSQETIRDLQ